METVGTGGVRLQPLVRRRVESLGDAGAAWVDSLPAVLDELAARWDLRLGRSMPGGSASYVVAAETPDGERRVLKIAVPGDSLADEQRVLREAEGWGYARWWAYDAAREAVLMEHCGPSLEHTPMPPGAKLDRLVDTLRASWTVRAVGDPPAVPGREKAESLAELVRELDARHPGACRPDVRDHALELAARRAADDDAPHVVVHGDPHPANALRIRNYRLGAESGWVFVDPDGFGCDPAYDLGVLLRDWTGRLLGVPPAEARAQLRRWCTRVVERSGLGVAALDRAWEWGLLERVSTGLYVTGFGAHEIGGRFLASAAHLLDD